MEQIHATCVDIEGAGVLLLGPSASGKSDLALRLMDGGARLVADDRVDLALEDGRLVASAPKDIASRIEVRGLGILEFDAQESSKLLCSQTTLLYVAAILDAYGCFAVDDVCG